MARQSKKHSCRYYDFYMDCCRNQDTHPCFFKCGGMTLRTEPPCRPSKNCGYEKTDGDHPRWDECNDESEGFRNG